VTVDGDTYNTIEEYIQHIVETNETVTILVNNNDGTYTYTSEDGTVTTVDVPSDIVNQFENIVKDGPVTVDGDTYNTIEEYIQHIVETNETVTTLAYNSTTNVLTYTNEDNNNPTIDLSGLSANIYTDNGTLTANRTVSMDNNFLQFENGPNTTLFSNNGTVASINGIGSSRGNITLNGGNATVDLYVDNSSAAQLTIRGEATSLQVGSTTGQEKPLHLITNGLQRVTVTPTGEMGIGTNTPTEKLDVDGNLRVRDVNT